jgi:hypothetical protein
MSAWLKLLLSALLLLAVSAALRGDLTLPL